MPECQSEQVIEFDVDASHELPKIINDWQPDYIINCIGIIKPYCKDDDPIGTEKAVRVNGLFPHYVARLAEYYNINVIRIATDCVYSGRGGKYKESAEHDPLDVYGKSMSLGEAISDRVLYIRGSIIGPELKGKLSLLEWFLARSEGEDLKGFTHHHWNGMTTLQYARLCQKIIEHGPDYFKKLKDAAPVHHYVCNTTVNKSELLKIFADVFNRRVNIAPVNNIGQPVDRSLATEHNLLHEGELIDMEEAIKELKEYMDQV